MNQYSRALSPAHAFIEARRYAAQWKEREGRER